MTRFTFGCLVALSLASSGSMCAARAATYYGTTEYGGTSNHGTIFKRDHGGPRVTLYSFCPDDRYCEDGAYPVGNLAPLPNGSFVGTTSAGGSGAGTIFQFIPATSGRKMRLLWNTCWVFEQCNYYGTADGTLQWTDTNKRGDFILEGVCDGPDGRGVFYSLTLGNSSMRIVPRDYWNHGPGDYLPIASVQLDL